MNKYTKQSSVGLLLALMLLTGCGSSDNDTTGDSVDNDTTNKQSLSAKFASQTTDKEAHYIDIADDLKTDINRLFGTAKDTPIKLKAGEKLPAIFDRLGS